MIKLEGRKEIDSDGPSRETGCPPRLGHAGRRRGKKKEAGNVPNKETKGARNKAASPRRRVYQQASYGTKEEGEIFWRETDTAIGR